LNETLSSAVYALDHCSVNLTFEIEDYDEL